MMTTLLEDHVCPKCGGALEASGTSKEVAEIMCIYCGFEPELDDDLEQEAFDCFLFNYQDDDWQRLMHNRDI